MSWEALVGSLLCSLCFALLCVLALLTGQPSPVAATRKVCHGQPSSAAAKESMSWPGASGAAKKVCHGKRARWPDCRGMHGGTLESWECLQIFDIHRFRGVYPHRAATLFESSWLTGVFTAIFTVILTPVKRFTVIVIPVKQFHVDFHTCETVFTPVITPVRTPVKRFTAIFTPVKRQFSHL